jgi:hypothetical protein
MITETPPVRAALDELRHELGGQRVDFGELTILGAHAKLRDLRNQDSAAREAREWLAREIREADTPVDVDAADEVKRLGLIVEE